MYRVQKSKIAEAAIRSTIFLITFFLFSWGGWPVNSDDAVDIESSLDVTESSHQGPKGSAECQDLGLSLKAVHRDDGTVVSQIIREIHYPNGVTEMYQHTYGPNENGDPITELWHTKYINNERVINETNSWEGWQPLPPEMLVPNQCPQKEEEKPEEKSALPEEETPLEPIRQAKTAGIPKHWRGNAVFSQSCKAKVGSETIDTVLPYEVVSTMQATITFELELFFEFSDSVPTDISSVFPNYEFKNGSMSYLMSSRSKYHILQGQGTVPTMPREGAVLLTLVKQGPRKGFYRLTLQGAPVNYTCTSSGGERHVDEGVQSFLTHTEGFWDPQSKIITGQSGGPVPQEGIECFRHFPCDKGNASVQWMLVASE